MSFTSAVFVAFFVAVLSLYWLLRRRTPQNVLLLVASYVFYGFIHPWFCLLLFYTSTQDFFCARALERFPRWKRPILAFTLASNLGLLAYYKYFNFFVDSFREFFDHFGLHFQTPVLEVILPAGISFYTFQSISYMIDVSRGEMRARKNVLDYFVFTSFFPQLVAGPIERAPHLLRQVEAARVWNWDYVPQAVALLVRGYAMKLVVADNLAPFVRKVFSQAEVSWLMMGVGTLAFTFQIYADFYGYSTIAQGLARLLGFELMDNFRSPYAAVSPSDFWRRWHISFSSWIRDYLYIPLGGSRVRSSLGFLWVCLVTMGLSGLWHGASWHFVIWGLFHGCMVFLFTKAGFGGRWQPGSRPAWFAAWGATFAVTLFGWLLFRTFSIGWLASNLARGVVYQNGREVALAFALLAQIAFFCAPLFLGFALERSGPRFRPVGLALCFLLIVVFAGEAQDFIYFQF